jgi:recombination protein RecA
MALDMNVVKKRGSWIAYKGESIAQGKELTMEKLEERPELMEEIQNEVLAKVAEANGLIINAPDTPGKEEPLFPGDIMNEALLEEGAIALDLDVPFPDE